MRLSLDDISDAVFGCIPFVGSSNIKIFRFELKPLKRQSVIYLSGVCFEGNPVISFSDPKCIALINKRNGVSL
jgi:hypothetical protein